MNWPNRLTISRIILVPVFITAIMYHELNIAFGIFLIAALTDALDGYIARTRRQKTRFGKIMDPIADKMLIGSAFICFSLVTGLPDHIKMPVYVPIIVISRDVFILLGALIMYLLTGSINVRPTALGKITTVFQISTVVALLVKFIYASWVWNIMVVLTIISGIDYLRISSKQVNEKL
ncbi:MAG: CDP-alcohol phosphatidyltransferase family protein [Candidatus Omnitrophica bacterium]|nr:CDP-alcohol phosphatidyltransferase family protein [Candidatus Omnitrophota bacterium]